MHHHELECHANRLVCYFQGQGHSKGSCDENITFFWLFSFLLTSFFFLLFWGFFVLFCFFCLLLLQAGSQNMLNMYILYCIRVFVISPGSEGNVQHGWACKGDSGVTKVSTVFSPSLLNNVQHSN